MLRAPKKPFDLKCSGDSDTNGRRDRDAVAFNHALHVGKIRLLTHLQGKYRQALHPMFAGNHPFKIKRKWLLNPPRPKGGQGRALRSRFPNQNFCSPPPHPCLQDPRNSHQKIAFWFRKACPPAGLSDLSETSRAAQPKGQEVHPPGSIRTPQFM